MAYGHSGKCMQTISMTGLQVARSCGERRAKARVSRGLELAVSRMLTRPEGVSEMLDRDAEPSLENPSRPRHLTLELPIACGAQHAVGYRMRAQGDQGLASH